MFDTLIQIDKQLLLAVNGGDSLFMDILIKILTTATTWIPFYFSLLYMVIRNSRNMKDVGLVLLCAALCTLIAGGVDDTIVKPMIGRWRPTHDPEIGYLVDVVNGYRSGKYGFFSAHAANTFSICVFFCLLVRNRIFTFAVVSWSLLNCWTRLYLGVHFPSDIFVGLCWGALTGIGVYYFYRYLTRDTHLMNYRHVDIDVVIGVLVMTLVYAVLKALIH